MVAIVSVYETGIVRAISDDGRPWTRQVANEVMAQAIATCPSGATGRLRMSHSVEQNRVHGRFDVGFTVYNDARHALWVHNGTGIYGPRGIPIRPVNTAKRKYLHMPPGFQPAWYWTNIRKGDFDPYGHKEEVDGDPGQPWLRRAGDNIAHRHGAF